MFRNWTTCSITSSRSINRRHPWRVASNRLITCRKSGIWARNSRPVFKMLHLLRSKVKRHRLKSPKLAIWNKFLTPRSLSQSDELKLFARSLTSAQTSRRSLNSWSRAWTWPASSSTSQTWTKWRETFRTFWWLDRPSLSTIRPRNAKSTLTTPVRKYLRVSFQLGSRCRSRLARRSISLTMIWFRLALKMLAPKCR